ncbi:MliC family protein [Edwardsiella piscicida]|uniref:MliC family protein n=1 Tax=Edwardsiella piscicida TaxID=1263550 RepID=UPI00370D7B2B
MMRFSQVIIAMLTLSGCQWWPGVTPLQTLHYRCGTLPLTVQQDNARRQVCLVLDGNALTLSQTLSASGVRYSDGRYTFWSKGEGAFVERDGNLILNDCRLQR